MTALSAFPAKTCCRCLDLRSGVLAIAFFSLVFTAFELSMDYSLPSAVLNTLIISFLYLTMGMITMGVYSIIKSNIRLYRLYIIYYMIAGVLIVTLYLNSGIDVKINRSKYVENCKNNLNNLNGTSTETTCQRTVDSYVTTSFGQAIITFLFVVYFSYIHWSFYKNFSNYTWSRSEDRNQEPPRQPETWVELPAYTPALPEYKVREDNSTQQSPPPPVFTLTDDAPLLPDEQPKPEPK